MDNTRLITTLVISLFALVGLAVLWFARKRDRFTRSGRLGRVLALILLSLAALGAGHSLAHWAGFHSGVGGIVGFTAFAAIYWHRILPP